MKHALSPWNQLTTLWGVAFGVLLVLTSFLAAGAGHGTFVPMLVSSAPFGIAGNAVAFATIPVLWAGIGLAFDLLSPAHARRVAAVALVVHYVSAIGILAAPESEVREFGTRAALGFGLVVWGPVYLGIQVVLWRAVRAAGQPGSEATNVSR